MPVYSFQARHDRDSTNHTLRLEFQGFGGSLGRFLRALGLFRRHLLQHFLKG